MARSMNVVFLIGNLGNDPEVRTGNNSRFIRFSLATSTEWMNKATNQLMSRTDWHRIVAYHPKIVELMEKMSLRKGAQVCVKGKIRKPTWQGADGKTQSAVEIEVEQFLMLSPPLSSNKQVPESASADVVNADDQPEEIFMNNNDFCEN